MFQKIKYYRCEEVDVDKVVPGQWNMHGSGGDDEKDLNATKRKKKIVGRFYELDFPMDYPIADYLNA